MTKWKTEKFESGKTSCSSWVASKINEIGMERFLQDTIDHLTSIPEPEPWLFLLIQDLEMTMADYAGRNQTEEQTEHI